MRSLPHAEDRNPGCAWHLREFTHLQVHHTSDDRQVQDSEPLHLLSYGQVYGLGNEGTDDLEDYLSVASRTIMERRDGPYRLEGPIHRHFDGREERRVASRSSRGVKSRWSPERHVAANRNCAVRCNFFPSQH